MSFDWDLTLRAVGVLVGAVATIYQLTKLKPRLRTTLKTDLEILKLLDPKDPNYGVVQAHVDRSIQQIYAREAPESAGRGLQVYNWGTLVFGLLLAGGFIFWTVYLVKDGFTPWALLTGFFALGGIGNIMNSLDPGSAGRSRKRAK